MVVLSVQLNIVGLLLGFFINKNDIGEALYIVAYMFALFVMKYY